MKNVIVGSLAALLVSLTVSAQSNGAKAPSSSTSCDRPIPKAGMDGVQLCVSKLPSTQHVIIRMFSAEDADLTQGEIKPESRTLQSDGPRLLAESFKDTIQKLGAFHEVSIIGPKDTVPAGAILVNGKFTEIDPGSRVKRYVIGFGAGKSGMSVAGAVKAADGTLLATFQQRRVGAVGVAGGDSIGKLVSDAKNIGEDIAKFMTNWAKGKID